jgi:penicillin-binding protein 2
MKVKGQSDKIQIITYIVVMAFLLLVMRLWQLQILQGGEYRKLSEANRLRIIAIPAPRGIIFDRNGIPLVKDSPYYYASVIPDEFDRSKIDLLAKVLNVSEN